MGELMLKFFENNFSQIVIAVFVLIAGYILSRIIGKSQHKRQQFSADITKFCVPFEKSLADLKAGKQAIGTIKSYMKEHLFAKDIFRQKLKIAKSKNILNSFDRFWDEYTCKKDNIDPKNYYLCYIDRTNTPEGEKKMNEKTQCNIQKILDFVNQL